MGLSVLVIANPAAGLNPPCEAGVRASRKLEQLGFRADLYCTSRPGDAERAAREAAGRFDIAIAAGGDGTVHEVANGLAGTGTPMGVLPLGSMNILAREIGMPLRLERACEWIARAEPQPIALGRRDDRWFVLMAGIGYDAFALARALARAGVAGRKVNFVDYTLAAWAAARDYAFPEIAAKVENETQSAAFAFVANCPRYGANLRIARKARLEEPLLDVVLFPAGGVAAIAKSIAGVLAGRPESLRGVSYRKVESVEIFGPGGQEVPCQLDGEIACPLPAVFRVVPAALLLLRSPRTT